MPEYSPRTLEIWTANEGPQREFVKSPIRDVCYGGARAGGKTVALLLHFVNRVKRYGEKAQGVIFRRSYPELGEIIRKGKKYLVGQLGWTYTGNPQFTFTSPEGATLMLRHALNLDDAKKYDGFEWTDLMFDEIGNWATSEVCDYLMGCLRSGEGVPTVRRSTCMPGGPGHVWVKERYQPDKEPEIRYLRPLEDRPDLVVESWFIRAVMEDNQQIDKAEYEATLAAASTGALFEAWRHGRWDVVAGAFFDMWNPATMVEREPAVRDWDVKWASCDWGYADDCVVLWHAQDENQRVVTYRELKVNKTDPGALGRRIVEANQGDRLAMFALSHETFAQRQSPRTIAEEIGKELELGGLPAPTRADVDRKGGWMLMAQLLGSGYWKIGAACEELVKAIPLMQRGDKDKDDVAESPYDHAPDAARYGLKTYLRGSRIPMEEVLRRYVAARLNPAMAVAEGQRVSDETETRMLGGRQAVIDRDGNVVRMESEEDAAARWTRTARLSAMASAKNRRRIRPKALPYGRRYGSF